MFFSYSSQMLPSFVAWCPRICLISFKLETDHKILKNKSIMAINKYHVHGVIANELHSRYEKVILYYKPLHSLSSYHHSKERRGSKDMEYFSSPAINYVHSTSLFTSSPTFLPPSPSPDEEPDVVVPPTSSLSSSFPRLVRSGSESSKGGSHRNLLSNTLSEGSGNGSAGNTTGGGDAGAVVEDVVVRPNSPVCAHGHTSYILPPLRELELPLVLRVIDLHTEFMKLHNK